MPRTKISEFSATPANNTDIDSINISEGCAPSGINDAIRELMAQLKDFQVGSAGDPVTVGGVLTVQAGSASTPALTTAGDTNTGIFFPAADTIAFAEGGAEVARFDSGGNLGLGVTPSAWWSSSKGFDIATVGAMWSGAGVNVGLLGNAYFGTGVDFRYKTTAAATRYDQAGGAHTWYNAPSGTAGNAITFTQAMTLDASGNLGLGITSPNRRFHAYGSGTVAQIESSTANVYLNFKTTSGDVFIGQVGTAFYVETGGSERARIDSSGNFFVNTTTGAAKVNFTASSQTNLDITTSGVAWSIINNQANAGTQYFNEFRYAGTAIGSITGNNTTTLYNTTSDYRLKTVVGVVSGQGARIDALKPIEYIWNSNGSITRGFLAHQFQEVYAGSVTGTKDAVDANGNPQYQAMQAGSAEVIADLVAEIQSLRKRLADAGI